MSYRKKSKSIEDLKQSKIVDTIQGILQKTGSDEKQKLNMFLQMNQYKRNYELMEDRVSSLIRENAEMVSFIRKNHLEPDAADEKVYELVKGCAVEEEEVFKCNFLLNEKDRIISELEKTIDRFERNRTESRAEKKENEINSARNVIVECQFPDELKKENLSLQAKIYSLEREINDNTILQSNTLEEKNRQLEHLKFNYKDILASYDDLKKRQDELEIYYRNRAIERCEYMEGELAEVRERAFELRKEKEDIVEKYYGLKCEFDEKDRALKKHVEMNEFLQEEVRKLSKSGRSVISKTNENEYLINELSSMAENYENTLEKINKLIDENNELKYEISKVKKENKDCKDEITALTSNLKDYKLKEVEINKHKDQLNEKERKFEMRVDELNKKILRYKDIINDMKDTISSCKKRCTASSIDLKCAKRKIETVVKSNVDIEAKLQSLSNNTNRLELENKGLKHNIAELEKYINGNKGGASDMYDIEIYRKILRCTLCDSRFKDTALVKCGHCFCRDCVDIRIKMRDRKCPICSEMFYVADIKKIYL